MSRGDSIYMQWEEKCRFAVSLIGLKVIAVFVVISMTFEGLSVTALAQDEIFSEGIYRTLFNDSGDSGYASSTISSSANTQMSNSDTVGMERDRDKGALSSVAGFIGGVAVFLIAISILGTIALQNEKNVYYNRSTDPEFDDEKDDD
ncbi:hypothetical protein [Butyrivibrio sp. M55]|jgi:hypothetical protein|uniref:hypothetical protein n=1 Tax=Butyrivibrio sp. M55 TaxID=1855323 RepID=UPI001113BCD4|nr:hypothetical protein [Butyrivibrio sp. M55]